MVKFPVLIYLTSVFGSFIAAYFSLPFWRAFCGRIGLVDDPGHRKIHEAPMPLAGSFAVLTGMLAPLLVGAAASHWNFHGLESAQEKLNYGLNRRALELGAIILGALGIVMLGLLDDKYELRPVVKFGGQLLVAVLVAAAGVRITLFVHSLIFSYAVTVLWILTVINALNFMDNMNGLCGGLGAIGTGFFAAIAAFNGHYLVALLGFLACGALLGFLPHNFPKATAFLGDAGSHLVGYLLAVMAILPHFYTPLRPRVWAVFIPLLVLAVPLADLVWVVLLRWRMGKPFYLGDTNHLSHRLVRRGLSQSNAVLAIWLMAAGAGLLSLLLVIL
jgi:UDP-GlcNAc:undecaprenyl-phosphate GlcNAc-1-phosphate transferase